MQCIYISIQPSVGRVNDCRWNYNNRKHNPFSASRRGTIRVHRHTDPALLIVIIIRDAGLTLTHEHGRQESRSEMTMVIAWILMNHLDIERERKPRWFLGKIKHHRFKLLPRRNILFADRVFRAEKLTNTKSHPEYMLFNAMFLTLGVGAAKIYNDN